MQYIDIQDIWRLTNNGEEIFRYYFPDFVPNKKFKARNNEKTASAMIRENQQGLYYFRDYGSDQVQGITAVKYVMQEEGLEFVDALNWVQRVIIKKDVAAGDYPKPRYSPEYESRAITPGDNKAGMQVVSRREELTDFELSVLGRFVDHDLCKEYNVRSILIYEVVDLKKNKVHVWKATDDYPIFEIGYEYEEKGEQTWFYKIYQPFNRDKSKRFMFIGTPPKDYIYGLKQLKVKESELSEEEIEQLANTEQGSHAPHLNDIIRVSGPSDLLALTSLGFNCYHTTSETDPMTSNQYWEVNKLCNRWHYVCFDIDETGEQSAAKFGMYYLDVRVMELPAYITKKKDRRGNKCKDIKDLIEFFSDRPVIKEGKEVDYDKFIAKEKITKLVHKLRYDAQPRRFWERIYNQEKGGNIKKTIFSLNYERLLKFLQSSGYYRTPSDEHKPGYCFASISGRKLIRLIDSQDEKLIKSEVKLYLRQFIINDKYKSKQLDRKKDEKIKLLNVITGSTKISADMLHLLPERKFSFKNYSRNYETLIFRNCAIKITRDEITRIKHEELEQHVIEKMKVGRKLDISQVNPRNYNHCPSPISVEPTPEFAELLQERATATSQQARISINQKIAAMPEVERYTIEIKEHFYLLEFLVDVARLYWREEQRDEITELQKKEQSLTLVNMFFNIGYVGSQYKDASRAWFTLIQDSVITELGKSSGRSGKSLICKLFSYFRVHYYIGAKQKKKVVDNQFMYDGLTKFHDVIEFDDLYEHADPNMFYAETTGKRSVESKYISPQNLSYEESGKSIISFNHVWKDNSPSAADRIQQGIVSDYFHKKTEHNDYKSTWTPNMKYGRNLFDDFTQHEWNLSAALIAYCIQLSMRFERIEPPKTNIYKRELQLVMEKGMYKFDVCFEEWAREYFATPNKLNINIPREEMQDEFNNLFPKGKGLSSQSFKTRLIAYCQFAGYEFDPLDLCNGISKELKKELESLPVNAKNLAKRKITDKLEFDNDISDKQTKEVFHIALPPPPVDAQLMDHITHFFGDDEDFQYIDTKADEYLEEFNNFHKSETDQEEFTRTVRYIIQNQ